MGSALVVGAGISGLASALALRQTGWDVTVLERDATPRAVGAGLVLWPNAIRALRLLGIADQVVAAATQYRTALARRPDGWVLTRVDMAGVARRMGEPVVTVLRADLHEILFAALGDVMIHAGAPVTRLGSGADDRPVVWSGDRCWDADLVVGADGLHSTIRSQLDAGGEIVPADYVAWRAVVPASRALRLDCGGETLGVGRRFGCAPLGRHGVYWYATVPGPLDDRPADQQLAYLRAALADWHAPIPELLAATDPGNLLQHQVTELWPLPRRFDHRIGTGAAVLVGDAAHAMTPNLGQGACLALEDAVTLGVVLSGGTELASALARYQHLRHRRATRLTRRSRQTGLALEMRRAVSVRLRDLLISVLPDSLAARSTVGPARWEPPGTATGD